MTTHEEQSKSAVAAATVIAGLLLIGYGADHVYQQQQNHAVERISDCYAHVMETHTGMTAADLADATRANARCH